MGTWGTGLYQSDAASDVRGVYRDCRKLGFSGADLVSIVLETAGLATADTDDYAPAYLALADLLWKDGTLPADVKATALSLIQTAKLPERFEDAVSQRKHAAVLQDLAERLRSVSPKQAAPRKLRFLRRKNIPILGEARKDEMLKGLIDHQRLPADATWQDYVDQYIAPHIPIIRVSERDPHFHKVVRTGVNTSSERPYHGDWWVATNAWTT